MRYVTILILFSLMIGCKSDPPPELTCRQIMDCLGTECSKVTQSPYSETYEIAQCLTNCARRGSIVAQRQFREIDICTDKLKYNPYADVSDCERLRCD